MGVTHVLNAAHGTAYSHGGQDFYGATIDYYGVPAHDLPSFDISQFFFSAAEFIHKALNTPGGIEWSLFTFVCVLAAFHNQSGPQAHWCTGQYIAYCLYLHGKGKGEAVLCRWIAAAWLQNSKKEWKVDVREGWTVAERDRVERKGVRKKREISGGKDLFTEKNKTCIWYGSSLIWSSLLTPSRGNCICHNKWIGRWQSWFLQPPPMWRGPHTVNDLPVRTRPAGLCSRGGDSPLPREIYSVLQRRLSVLALVL